MNAEFVPDFERPEVTWMGTTGVVIDTALHYAHSRVSGFKFDSKERTVHIGNVLTLPAITIQTISSENGTISLVKRDYKDSPALYPTIKFHLEDVGLDFSVKYENDHLDMFWHSPIRGNNCHGLIGMQNILITINYYLN